MIDNGFTVGMRVLMRKPHACGSSEWEITRTGADVKIKCTGCGRVVMLDRGDFMRAAVKLMGGVTCPAGEQANGNSTDQQKKAE